MKDQDKLKFAEKYIDLHLHLDGAITVDIAGKLAKIQNIELPSDEEVLTRLFTVPEKCADLNEFLACFDAPLSLLQTPEGLCEAVQLVAENIRSQGVIYAEIRFAPQLHTSKGMTQEDAVKAALEGLKRSALKANIILCCMRGEGNEAQNDETVMLAAKYIVEDGGVTAIDLAGAEALFPTEKYETMFAKARGYGIPFTIHAGEAAGPESVAAALSFGAKRIGHGVRICEDAALTELVRQQGIFLEMCPTSNRQTHAVDDMTKYPFADFLKKGIRVTLNTDDMGIEQTTLADEFRYMEKMFGLDTAQKNVLLRNAVDAAFTSENVKAKLREQLLL